MKTVMVNVTIQLVVTDSRSEMVGAELDAINELIGSMPSCPQIFTSSICDADITENDF